MALVLKDRVQETTTTTGTGTITLAGAISGFQSFSVIGNGNTCYYTIQGGAQWEVGVGTYTASGTTLSRDSVLESSNSGSLVNFSAGTKNVFVTYPAERAVTLSDIQTLTNKTISMSGLLQLDKSSDIVAAATTDLGTATGNAVTVTHSGTTLAITSLGGSSLQSGTELTITWSVSGGSLSVTHNATSLILPSGADLPIADGDVWKVQKIADGLSYWRVIDITKADGTSTQGVPTGSILDYGGNSAPTGFLLCDGANVNRITYAALFAVIGTNFGVGDGSTTFTLPDFRRRVAVGAGGTGTAKLGNSVGSSGGAETHTLTQAEMPNHTHVQNGHSHTQRYYSTGVSGNSLATVTKNGAIGNSNTTTTSTTATNQNTGGGGAHNNMQPSLVVLKIIKT